MTVIRDFIPIDGFGIKNSFFFFITLHQKQHGAYTQTVRQNGKKKTNKKGGVT